MFNNESKLRMEYLSARSFTGHGNNYIDAVKVSNRLLGLTQFLNIFEKIGLQITMSRKKETRNYIFASSYANVSIDDFNWIFKDFAKVIQEKYVYIDETSTSGQKEYELIYSSDKTENVEKNTNKEPYISEYEQYSDKNQSRQYFNEMYDEMRKVDANIKVILWNSESNETLGSGKIILSFPGDVPMRIRTLISIVFPNTFLREVSGKSEDTYLPKHLLSEYIPMLLQILGNEQRSFDKDPDDESIDFLELSVRPTYCLKKAGITTIKQLCKTKEEDIVMLRNLGRKSFEEIQQKLNKLREERPEYFSDTVESDINYIQKLETLIGIKAAKEQIMQITAFAKMQKDMRSHNLEAPILSLNMEFIGNPGTAKTTVARIVAGIFSRIGLTKSNALIEVGRAELIADYVGQTAGKVKEAFKKAKGKVLFIDEAYSLMEDRRGSFGDEAINTIVWEMENNREDTIVIFAGYPKEMKKFFSKNPGLRSRVPFTVRFDDYSSDELVEICKLEAKKRCFTIEDSAVCKIKEICEKAKQSPDMGNGRFCRNLTERAILKFAARVYGSENISSNVDYTLISDDFVEFDTDSKETRTPIGFQV